MRGYCAKCQEYRSDNGLDVWKIVWDNGLALCERCGSVVDVWKNESGDQFSEHGQHLSD